MGKRGGGEVLQTVVKLGLGLIIPGEVPESPAAPETPIPESTENQEPKNLRTSRAFRP